MLQPELKFRRDKIRYLMAQQGIDAALIACNVNLLYTYGEIVNGYLYLPLHSPALLFVKRPNNIVGEFVFPIRKPEQIVDLLKENGIPVASKIMLEGGELPYADYMRLASLFPESEVVDGTAIIREARSVKTPLEIELFRRSAALHARAYSKIPDVYHPGMTDRELSVEVERLMRLEGCLGIFRVFGQSMEIFMGSVLAGDNAATPSPYDFALGGKGLDPSLPGGMNGTLLKEGYSVMVDIGGNFYGYMCDMSRVFSIGKLNDEAYAAHQVCLEVQDKVASMTAPGVVCEDLYNGQQGADGPRHDTRGSRCAARPRVCEQLLQVSVHDLPDTDQVPRRGASPRRTYPRARVHYEGRVFIPHLPGGSRGILHALPQGV